MTPVPTRSTERLMAQAGGNPLALVELPTDAQRGPAAGAAPMPAQLPPHRRRRTGLPGPVPAAARRRCRPCCWSPPPTTPATAPWCARPRPLGAGRDGPRRRGTVRAAGRRRRERAGAASRWSAPPSTRRRPAGTARSAPGARAAAARPRRRRPVRLAPGRGRRRPGRRGRRRACRRRCAGRTTRRVRRRDGRLRARRRAGRRAGAARRPRVRGRPQRLGGRPSSDGADAAPRPRALADDRACCADIDRLRGRIEVNVGSAIDAHRIFAAAARAVLPADPARALELAVPRR